MDPQPDIHFPIENTENSDLSPITPSSRRTSWVRWEVADHHSWVYHTWYTYTLHPLMPLLHPVPADLSPGVPPGHFMAFMASMALSCIGSDRAE